MKYIRQSHKFNKPSVYHLILYKNDTVNRTFKSGRVNDPLIPSDGRVMAALNYDQMTLGLYREY